MIIMVTGASGLLGSHFIRIAQYRGHDLIAGQHRTPVVCDNVRVCRIELSEPDRVIELLRRFQPDWLVHAAAMTDVDYCQGEPSLAMAANIAATYHLCDAASSCKIPVLFVSTDSVFNGERGGYSESDLPDPINIYAKTKLTGEEIVKAYAPAGSLIVRTNFYGRRHNSGRSLVDWILDALRWGTPIPGFQDVVMNPLWVNDLSEILLDMMLAGLSGTYHVAGGEVISKYAFARKVAGVFDLDESLIYPQSIDDSVLKAPRPKNTSLLTERIGQALTRAMPDIDSGLWRLKMSEPDLGCETGRNQKGNDREHEPWRQHRRAPVSDLLHR